MVAVLFGDGLSDQLLFAIMLLIAGVAILYRVHRGRGGKGD
jgi:hypothetical protein